MNIVRHQSIVRLCAARLRNTLLAVVLTSGLGASFVVAQERVTGIITNAATGRTLEGAKVTIKGTAHEVITDSQGVYSFPSVPSGATVMTVSYTGLETAEIPFDVRSGVANRKDVGLTAEIYKMSQFVVASEREGNAQAITLQKQSSGIKNIVSTDAFGNLAGNPAELLVRLVGIEGEEKDGDVRVVRIRGINQNLTTVTMDGNKLPDASDVGGNREFTFQTVSSETIERMEVVKSPTPDMDGDSIGGAVNMISKSGFDSAAGRRVKLSFGATWRAFDARPTRAPRNYLISYSDVFAGKLAVALNVGYRGIYNPQDVVTQLHEAVPNGSPAPAYTYSVAFNDSREEQGRQGGGVKFDYKLSDSTRFYFNTNLVKNIEHQGDRYATFSTAQAAANFEPGWTEELTRVRPLAASTLAMRSYTAYKQGKTTTFQVGGVHKFKWMDIDYDTYRSQSKSNFTGQRSFVLTAPGVGFTIDKSDEKWFPVVTQTAGPDITKIESYLNNTYSIGRKAGWDRFSGGSLNLKKNFEAKYPFYVKTGVRRRIQERQNEDTSWSGAYVGPDGVQGVNPANGINDDNLGQFGFVEPGEFTTKKTRYPNIPHPAFPGRTNNKLDDALKTSPQLFTQNIATDVQQRLTGDQTFKETIDGAYLMGNVDVGKFSLLSGVRVEKTEVDAEGALQQITPAEKARRAAWVGTVTNAELTRRTVEEFSGRQTRSGKYTDYLPGVHLKYAPNARLVARLSWAKNIGRPNVGQLIPRTNVNYDLQTISTSNPNLKPQIANNYDLSVEYYFKQAGMMSVGLFRKELRQFIYTAGGEVVGTGVNNGFNGEYAGFLQTTQYNGGSARVQGYELAASQQFTFLPGIWSGLGAYANYTHMTTEGNYGNGNSIALAPLPPGKIAGFNPEVANAGLSYIRNGWTLRLNANYRARFLTSYNAVESRQIYAAARTQVDIKMLYTINRRFDLYLDVNNIFNAYDRQSEYAGGRPQSVYWMSPSIIFGTNIRL
jgi:iron complex outermembrane receptor protein